MTEPKLMHRWHLAKWKMADLLKQYHEWQMKVEEAAGECGLPLIYMEHGLLDLKASLERLKYEPGNLVRFEEKAYD